MENSSVRMLYHKNSKSGKMNSPQKTITTIDSAGIDIRYHYPLSLRVTANMGMAS
jgi:hypothetical protein